MGQSKKKKKMGGQRLTIIASWAMFGLIQKNNINPTLKILVKTFIPRPRQKKR
jgi:Na+/H+ antiporter NhaC